MPMLEEPNISSMFSYGYGVHSYNVLVREGKGFTCRPSSLKGVGPITHPQFNGAMTFCMEKLDNLVKFNFYICFEWITGLRATSWHAVALWDVTS